MKMPGFITQLLVFICYIASNLLFVAYFYVNCPVFFIFYVTLLDYYFSKYVRPKLPCFTLCCRATKNDGHFYF